MKEGGAMAASSNIIPPEEKAIRDAYKDLLQVMNDFIQSQTEQSSAKFKSITPKGAHISKVQLQIIEVIQQEGKGLKDESEESIKESILKLADSFIQLLDESRKAWVVSPYAADEKKESSVLKDKSVSQVLNTCITECNYVINPKAKEIEKDRKAAEEARKAAEREAALERDREKQRQQFG